MREPRFIELDEAVSRIKQACENRSKDLSPFFFMVGAGISYPSVPLAMDIVSACKEVAQRYGRSAEPQGTNGIDQYSHWFETAYAERYQRQRYLRELIEGKPITHANFRLAHLLLDNTLSNIVVTTNFDDFLPKALALFGKAHIVCDHPQTVGRINHTAPILQIVHLHGSYWFYDCCNLRGELEDRAQQSRQTTLTMASLLDMILWDRSPLIIGYSGWEGDVFTEALRRRLATSLPSNIYWFCYRRTEVDSIPDWLKYHPDILFVVPAKTPTLGSDVDAARMERISEAAQTSVEGIDVKGFSPMKDGEPVLPADTVFATLIQAFALKAPNLTSDPLGFFATHLDNSLPKESASDSATDIYGIKRVIERVRKAKQRDDEETAKTTTTPSETRLEQVRDALRRADYQEVVARGTRIDLRDLTIEELDELADAMWVAGRGLGDNSEEAISAYDMVVTIRDHLSKEQSNETDSGRLQAAKALFNKGVTLGALKRSVEAIAVYDELESRYGQEPELPFKEHVARALRNKGIELVVLNRAEEEIAISDELVKRYGGEPGAVLREQVAAALINKGYALGGILNRNEEAVAAYDEAVQRYIEDPEITLRGLVALALRNKGGALGALNRHEEAIAAYDEVVKRYGEDPALALREHVAMALVNKGYRLSVLNREDEAISVYDEVVRRYGEDPAPKLREQVARALRNKANALNRLNQQREAAAPAEKS